MAGVCFRLFEGIDSRSCRFHGGGAGILPLELAGHGKTHGNALPAELHGAGLAPLAGQVEMADAGVPVELGDVGGICHFHLSGKASEPGPMKFCREGVPMGLPMASEFERQYASPAAVKAAREAIDSLK